MRCLIEWIEPFWCRLVGFAAADGVVAGVERSRGAGRCRGILRLGSLGVGVRGGTILLYVRMILMVLRFIYANLRRRGCFAVTSPQLGSVEAGRSNADTNPV